MKNKFEVDLGNLDLTATQHNAINAAIQHAVSAELAKINLKNQLVLIPIRNWPKGPIINGIIARELNADMFKSVVKEMKL
jgi:hypothetical protein